MIREDVSGHLSSLVGESVLLLHQRLELSHAIAAPNRQRPLSGRRVAVYGRRAEAGASEKRS